MAGRDGPKVYSVTLKKRGLIEVDVERYTFVFTGRPTDEALERVRGWVHGKRDPEIDPYDLFALRAERAAEAKARYELKSWAHENPLVHLEHVQQEVIWLHPDHQAVTPEQASINRDMVEELTKRLAQQLSLPFRDRDRLP